MSESDDLVPSDLSERIFKARVGGLTEQATAKKFGVPVREVRKVVEQLAPRIDAGTRLRELSLELVRLDRLQEVFLDVALTQRDPQAAAIALKVSERKSSMLGLDYAPLRTDQGTLHVIQPAPRPSSTALIRAALERVCAEGRPAIAAPTLPPAPDEIIEPEEPSS